LGRCHSGERCEHRPRQRVDPTIAACRAFRQARIDEQQRHAAQHRLARDVRPQLGLDEKTRARREMREETADREGQVVGKPRLHDPLAEQRASRLAAGRGHVRQDDRLLRHLAQQALDQRRRCARFAERHRMNPQRATGGPAKRRRVTPEALEHVRAISGLASPAPPQAQRQKRQREPPQRRVDAAHRA